MKPVFNEADIEAIAETLCTKWSQVENKYRMPLLHPKKEQVSLLEIFPAVSTGVEKGAIVSVYMGDAHLQLQNCTGYVVSKMLGEVIFVAVAGDKVTGLVVAHEAGCSLFANVDKSVITGDFTRMAPEVTMSGVALSLAEDLIG